MQRTGSVTSGGGRRRSRRAEGPPPLVVSEDNRYICDVLHVFMLGMQLTGRVTSRGGRRSCSQSGVAEGAPSMLDCSC